MVPAGIRERRSQRPFQRRTGDATAWAELALHPVMASPPAEPAASFQRLAFKPLAFAIRPSFWEALAPLHLNVWRLQSRAHPLAGYYSPLCDTTGPTLCLRAKSLVDWPRGGEILQSGIDEPIPGALTGPRPDELPLTAREPVSAPADVVLSGELLMFHTVEAFRSADRRALADDLCARWWAGATTATFLVTVFADLKRGTFAYWCVAPVCVAVDHRRSGVASDVGSPTLLSVERLSMAQETAVLAAASSSLHSTGHDEDPPDNSCCGVPLLGELLVIERGTEPTACVRRFADWVRRSRSSGDGLDDAGASFALFDGVGDVLSGADVVDSPLALGWLTRRALTCVAAALRVSPPADDGPIDFDFVVLRPADRSRQQLTGTDDVTLSCSLSLRIRWGASSSPTPTSSSRLQSGKEFLEWAAAAQSAARRSILVPPTSAPDSSTTPTPLLRLPEGFATVGWELNERGESGPRVLRALHHPQSDDLQSSSSGGTTTAGSSSFSKTTTAAASLAATALDLNLGLMRWRMLPELVPARLAACRVLILGAGTLGCHLARDLLPWGFTRLTIVDNGRVSLSNPVRQPLFEAADATADGGLGRLKAEAAAAALGRIRPGLDVAWHALSIPSPGHAVHAGEEAAVRADVALLSRLVADCDVAFLLTDSRESRWLPALMAAAAGKLAITVALGFDSALVIRHGVRVDHAAASPTEGRPASASAPSAPFYPLGCYFCIDAVAPRDSSPNRTLDQQCTVTRPGVAPLACALAVELLVALLHHPCGQSAPHDPPAPLATPTASPLGLVPHTLRYFLTHAQPMLGATPTSPHCPACSPRVVRAWKEGGVDWLLGVLNEDGSSADSGPSILEKLVGLGNNEAAAAEAAADGVLAVGGDDDF